MSARLTKLREERASVWEEMKPLLDDESGEARTKYEACEKRLDDLTGEIERVERHEAREAEFARVDRSAIPEQRTEEAPDTEADYRAAFELWTRYGNVDLSSEQRAVLRTGFVDGRELRAQGVGTTTAGGYLVPAQFRNKLVETLKYYSGVRQVAEVITTDNGASLPWPTNNDTANVGAILAENTQVTEQDLVLGQASIDVYMYTSKLVRVSLQLIQDSAIDIEEFLPRKLGERIGRAQNAHFTTGTGTAQPQGIVTGATATQAAAGNTTSIPYVTFVDGLAAIDPAYLNGGNLAWMTSQAGLASARKLLDSQNRPLWQPSLQAGQPDLFLGHPVVLNNDMPAPAASAKSWLFGDFRAAYLVRDVTGVQTLRLDERYADFLQVGFLGFQRSGGMVQDASAIRALQNSAT